MTTNVDIVRAHYTASAQGNIEEIMAHVSAQVCWTKMAGFPCAGTWVGPQAVIDNVFAVLGRVWIGYRFELQSLIDGGDQIVGVGTYHGTYRVTGKEMRARVAHVWKLQDGKNRGLRTIHRHAARQSSNEQRQIRSTTELARL